MKRNIYKKAAAVLLAGTLCLCGMATGCQKTPEAEAVVFKEADVPAEALKGDSATPDPQMQTEPATYSVQEHWQESVEKGENFKIVADVDVMTPDVEAYPVLKLETRPLTQEMVQKIADRLVPGGSFFQDNPTKTKADWEADILSLKETLEMDRQSGDAQLIEMSEQALQEAQESYAAAPEAVELTPAAIEFTYQTDFEGNPMAEEGERFMNLSTNPGDGSYQKLYARKESEDMSQQAYFMFYDVDYSTEASDQLQLEQTETERASLDSSGYDPESLEEEKERLDEQERMTRENLPKYEQNPMDLEKAKADALAFLKEVDIPGMQVTLASRALLSPSKNGPGSYGDGDESLSLNEHGVYLELHRENGGIPIMNQQSVAGSPDTIEAQYSAPFFPETVSMILDTNGKVRMFNWESPANVVEVVAPDSEIMPFSEVKERLTDAIYRNEIGATTEEFLEEHGFEYVVDEVQLQMSYVNAKDDPDKVLAIPAWYVDASGYPADSSKEGNPFNAQQVSISALDGSPILMPRSMQDWTIMQ